MRKTYLIVVLIGVSGCSGEVAVQSPRQPDKSCAWHILNEDITDYPSHCDSVAFEYAREYVKEHPELEK
jgi:hypothetical protein